MTAKKKTKRPPRQVFILVDAEEGQPTGVNTTKKGAVAGKWEDETVVGPYILAERVVNK